MSCSPSWKDGYWELNFICSLLALSPYAPTLHSSGWLLFIRYLVLTTCLVLCKPENEGYLSSRKLLYRTNRWNSPSVVPIFTDELYSVLPFFSNNLWEVGVCCFFFFFSLNLKHPVPLWRSYCKCCHCVWSSVKPSGSCRPCPSNSNHLDLSCCWALLLQIGYAGVRGWATNGLLLASEKCRASLGACTLWIIIIKNNPRVWLQQINSITPSALYLLSCQRA